MNEWMHGLMEKEVFIFVLVVRIYFLTFGFTMKKQIISIISIISIVIGSRSQGMV